MRRVANILLRNWPLRLVAILLATLLYTGLVLGQNVRTWTGELPVDGLRPPAGATLLTDLSPVTLIRYRAPLEVGVLSPDSFRATVDLSRVDAQPGGPAVTLPVTVVALDQRIQIVDFQPQTLEVRLDPVEVRQLPVTVTFGTVPEGLNVGPPQAEPSSVTVRGASSRVESVSAVVARVAIDASALNIDREIELIPVDAIGNQVTNVEVDPQRARVRIAVARQLATRTLPVVPQLFGTLAPGYRISSVTVEPLVLTVSGEESIVTRLESAPTQAINIDGRTTDLEAMVGLALPEGVSVVGSDQVRVILTITQEDATTTLLLGVGISGTQCACIYDFNTTAVSVTLAGPPAELDALDTLNLQVVADVTGLGPGTHSVSLQLAIPGTLEVVSILPTGLDLFIQAATPLPGPT